MFYMFVDQNYHIWFYIAEICQFVSYITSQYHMPISMIYNKGFGEHQVRCYLIAVWWRGSFGQNIRTFAYSWGLQWKGWLKNEGAHI